MAMTFPKVRHGTQTAQWHAEHACFARLLHLMDTQLAGYRDGHEPDYVLMRDIVRYLQEFADPFHHAFEDAAFERLAKRAPHLQAKIRRLVQEHRVLAKSGEIVLRLLEKPVRHGVVEPVELEAATATYLLYYHRHLVEEEREIVPAAARLLHPTDWAAIARTAAAQQRVVAGRPEYRAVRDRVLARGFSIVAIAA